MIVNTKTAWWNLEKKGSKTRVMEGEGVQKDFECERERI